MSLVKINKKPNIRTTPFVNVLVRISYNHQVLITGTQDINQFHFRNRAVLRLVYHYVIQTFLPFIADFFVIFQKIKCIAHQVCKIQTVDGFLSLEVIFNNLVILVFYFIQNLNFICSTHLWYIR